MEQLDRQGKTNPARDRIWGGGQPYTLGAAPDVADFTRWTLAHAERAAQEAASGPPEP